jgi:hypothetical protein
MVLAGVAAAVVVAVVVFQQRQQSLCSVIVPSCQNSAAPLFESPLWCRLRAAIVLSSNFLAMGGKVRLKERVFMKGQYLGEGWNGRGHEL